MKVFASHLQKAAGCRAGRRPHAPQGDRPPPRPAAQQDGRRESAPFGNPLTGLPSQPAIAGTPPAGGGKSRRPHRGRWSPVATIHRRSPLPRPSVLDAPHWGAGPEPAGETVSSQSDDGRGDWLCASRPLTPSRCSSLCGRQAHCNGRGNALYSRPKGGFHPPLGTTYWTALSVGYRRHLPRRRRQVLAPLWGPPFGASLRRDDSVIRGARILRPGTVRFCEASSFIPFHIL